MRKLLGEHDRRIIIGFPGSGKSTFAEKLTAPEFRVVWFDPGDDYSAPGRLTVSLAELERFPKLLLDPHARIVVRPAAEAGRDLADEYVATVRVVRAARDVVFVQDEAGDYASYAADTMRSLFRSGATHDGVRSLLIAHVCTDVPLRCRKMATHVHIFAQPHAEELRAVASAYGEDVAERVSAWRRWEPPVTWVPPFQAEEARP